MQTTNSIDFQNVIIQGIKGLPKNQLVEIADFVFFIKQKNLKSYSLKEELSIVGRHEIEHLEEEFKNFEIEFPKE